MSVVTYYWLNFHLPYACRHSGACCTANWPIPIERDRAAFFRSREGLVGDPATPEEYAGVLARRADGSCVFHDGRCGVYERRPKACVHFPYVCLIDARGVHVTLSHYCPTAAALLFQQSGPIDIVEGPPPIAGLDVPEGLDARESLPPLAAPYRLMSFEEFSAWERDELKTLPALVGDVPFAEVVERYLAAKLFASWAAYEGDGVSAVRAAVREAHRVLQDEIARACVAAGRPLDASLLTDAIRQADLRVVHAVR